MEKQIGERERDWGERLERKIEEIEERKLMTVISSRAFIVGAQARARIESNDRRYGDESFCLVRARERKPAERLLTSYGK